MQMKAKLREDQRDRKIGWKGNIEEEERELQEQGDEEEEGKKEQMV